MEHDASTPYDKDIIAAEIKKEALEAQIAALRFELQDLQGQLQQLREWAWDDLGIDHSDDSNEAHEKRYAYLKHLMKLGHYMHNTTAPWTNGAAARMTDEGADTDATQD